MSGTQIECGPSDLGGSERNEVLYRRVRPLACSNSLFGRALSSASTGLFRV